MNIFYTNKDNINIYNQDLKGKNLVLNPYTKNVHLTHVRNIGGVLDFSQVKKLVITSCDIHETVIKWPQDADEITLININKLPKIMKLNHTKKLKLERTDIKNSTIFWPKEHIVLSNLKVYQDLEFQDVQSIVVENVTINFTNQIVFPRQIIDARLENNVIFRLYALRAKQI